MSKLFNKKKDPDFDCFKPLMYFLKRQNKSDFVKQFIEFCTKHNLKAKQSNKIYPWTKLFILKMSFVFSELQITKNKIKFNDLMRYYTKFEDCDDRHFNASTKYGIEKFMRTKKQSQHIFQFNHRMFEIVGLQYFLYEISNSKIEISNILREKTGADFAELISNIFILTLFFTDQKTYCKIGDLVVFKKNINEINIAKHIDTTLKILSNSIEESSALAKKDFNYITTLIEELSSPSPFVQKPFVYIGELEGYYLLSNELLLMTLESYTYNFFKYNTEYAQKFCDYTSINFEKLVRKIIEFKIPKISFHDEVALKRIYPNTKICDFVLEVGVDKIFIDAKCVGSKFLANISTHEDSLKNNYKSIVKGIAQSLNTIKKMGSKKENSIIFVVTLFETYIGHGSSIFSEFVSQSLQDDYGYSNEEIESLIDKDQTYIISIYSFNKFMSNNIDNKMYPEFLQNLRISDKKGYFDLYLDDFFEIKRNDALNELYSEFQIKYLPELVNPT